MNRELELQSLELFGNIRRRLNLCATQELKSLGIGPKQAVIIRAVAESRACSLACISRTTASDPAAVGRAIDSLVGSGWLSKKEHPNDRRQWIVELTAAGAKRVKTLERAFEAVAERLAGALNPKEQKDFVNLLEKIENSLQGSP